MKTITRENFHRDQRVIAARKQYRVDLNAGLPEREAWAKQKAVNDAVIALIVNKSCKHGYWLTNGKCDPKICS